MGGLRVVQVIPEDRLGARNQAGHGSDGFWHIVEPLGLATSDYFAHWIFVPIQINGTLLTVGELHAREGIPEFPAVFNGVSQGRIEVAGAGGD